MKYCFGPVPSRRLGLSLGVDILPAKTCNLSCIYCEIGRTTNFTCKRAAYLSTDSIKRELEGLIVKKNIQFDCLTFTASGEPTLHSDLGNLLLFARTLTSKPLVVLTNGTLIWMDEVREALCNADLVLPSLDAVRPRPFRRVNRPLTCIKPERVIEGICRLRRETTGQIWVETLLVKGINDAPEDIRCLENALNAINPHRIQINTVVRPPAVPWARPLSLAELEQVRNILGKRAEIIASFKKNTNQACQSIEETRILEMLARRPLTLEDIANLTGADRQSLKLTMRGIKEKGLINTEHHGKKFFFTSLKKGTGNNR